MLSRNSTKCVKAILIYVYLHNAAVEVWDPNNLALLFQAANYDRGH